MQQASAYIQSLSKGGSPLAGKYSKLGEFFDKKLWHQLTEELLVFVQEPYFRENFQELIELYNKFIKSFETKMNQLILIKILLVIAHLIGEKDGNEAVKFLTNVCEKISKNEKEAHCLARTELAYLKMTKLNQFEEAKQIVDEVFVVLDTLTGADPLVYSSYYQVLSGYYKSKVQATEFFRNTLIYLLYTPLEEIPTERQQEIAFDLGMTALVSPDIHNFGELLSHQILQSLENTDKAWLVKILFAFNSGSIDLYEKYLKEYEKQIGQLDILKQNLVLLREKISILALMELVFSRPADQRTIPFETIASATKLELDKVERLVMRAMSLKLLKGTIDEVNSTVTMTWVQPRVLDLNQVAKMKDRLSEWSGRVHEVLSYVENQTAPELLT